MRIIKAQVVPLGEPLSAKAALDAFNRLSEFADDFVDGGWSPEQVFWSRYFWIRTYANIVQSPTGRDARLEQFIFKLLEQPFPHCEPDWAWIERVGYLSSHEVERWSDRRRESAPESARFLSDADTIEMAAHEIPRCEPLRSQTSASDRPEPPASNL